MSEKNLEFTTKDQRTRHKLSDFLRRFRTVLSLSDEELSDHLLVNSKDLDRLLKGHEELDILKLCNLAKVYNFNLDALFEGQFDFEALRQQRAGNSEYLPARYTVGAFSKKRLIHTVLNYVEDEQGWIAKENILSFFQMANVLNSNPEEKINVYLFEDVLTYLLKLNYSREDILHIGRKSVEATRNTSFEAQLSKCRSPRELFEKYFDDLIFFIEHNNHYRIISSSEYHCEVESHEIPENLDIFKVTRIGGPLRCVYRTGALEAATNYIGLPHAHVTETKCVHRGDTVCTFLISFDHLSGSKVSGLYH